MYMCVNVCVDMLNVFHGMRRYKCMCCAQDSISVAMNKYTVCECVCVTNIWYTGYVHNNVCIFMHMYTL